MTIDLDAMIARESPEAQIEIEQEFARLSAQYKAVQELKDAYFNSVYNTLSISASCHIDTVVVVPTIDGQISVRAPDELTKIRDRIVLPIAAE
jgi:hypothetical protein